MTQITHPAVTKYDLALLFTLIVLIDDRMGDLETENQRLPPGPRALRHGLQAVQQVVPDGTD